jgi:hypothetical protein
VFHDLFECEVVEQLDQLGVGHAERELRGLVCWRRCSGGTQSERGNRFAANLKSVIHTCRKQRRHVLAYLHSAIHASLQQMYRAMFGQGLSGCQMQTMHLGDA